MRDAKAAAGSVLIVDDVPANLQLLVDSLSGSGFDVFVAKSGESALEQLGHSTPDIILLDVKMPGIDGFETCRRLKAADQTRDIPVIFMTALTDTVEKVKGFEAGAVDYVTKPIEHQEMLARSSRRPWPKSRRSRIGCTRRTSTCSRRSKASTTSGRSSGRARLWGSSSTR